mmetsp:Transcript_17843/g.33179  ORF Transcript_17843/g.33179 Transcript_17843/m.33179 type:complete len:212 (-) Transcript_17843:84-719(-)
MSAGPIPAMLVTCRKIMVQAALRVIRETVAGGRGKPKEGDMSERKRDLDEGSEQYLQRGRRRSSLCVVFLSLGGEETDGKTGEGRDGEGIWCVCVCVDEPRRSESVPDGPEGEKRRAGRGRRSGNKKRRTEGRRFPKSWADCRRGFLYWYYVCPRQPNPPVDDETVLKNRRVGGMRCAREREKERRWGASNSPLTPRDGRRSEERGATRRG